ncbi:MAG TPA: hypothetical protein VLS94_01445 [Fusibacter sp.]|nr:hypothetical protein [Fusibacter sp.]
MMKKSLCKTVNTKKNVQKRGEKKWRLYFSSLVQCERGEFGMSAIIGIAIGLIIAAFILIPGLQTFATTIMSDMELWWTNSISSQIFPN